MHTDPLIVSLMIIFKHIVGVSMSLEEEIKSFIFKKCIENTEKAASWLLLFTLRYFINLILHSIKFSKQ